MATIQRFEDLKVWQEARVLSITIYKLTTQDLFSRDFSLKDQIRRSSGSVMDNIAEGFDRDGNKEFIRFLTISKGSISEVKSQLYRANDLNYIDPESFKEAMNQADEIGKMLGGFIKYLKNSEMKGSKYKVDEPTNIYYSSAEN